MIQSVLNNLSRGLIALLVVSFIAVSLSGCARVKVSGKRINDPFYPEYYSVKKLDSDDVIRLRGYASSPDLQISDAASLILGHYYLKSGDKSYGDFLINKYYDSPALTEQMKLYGKIWKVESLMAIKKRKDAEKIASDIKKMTKSDVFIKTMNSYCNRAGISAVKNNFDECIDSIGKAKDMPPAVVAGTDNSTLQNGEDTFDNMTYNDYAASQQNDEAQAPALDKDSVINIVDGEVMSDYAQGMIYAISKLGASYQINAVSGSDAEAQKYAVNIKSKTEEIDIGNQPVYIGINWDEMGYIASNLTFIDNYTRVIIAVPDNKTYLGKSIEKRIKERDKYAKIINYSNSNFQGILRAEIERANNSPLLMIGIGDENEILTFAPIAKYLQSSSATQRILLVTSAIKDVKNDPAYGAYFKDVYLLSPIKFIDNKGIQKTGKDFEKFFGLKMTSENMIGYDTIIYINSLLDNDPKPDYLTNIAGFINFKAHRPIGLYRFDKQLQLSQEMLELVPGGDKDDDLLENQ